MRGSSETNVDKVPRPLGAIFDSYCSRGKQPIKVCPKDVFFLFRFRFVFIAVSFRFRFVFVSFSFFVFVNLFFAQGSSHAEQVQV